MLAPFSFITIKFFLGLLILVFTVWLPVIWVAVTWVLLPNGKINKISWRVSGVVCAIVTLGYWDAIYPSAPMDDFIKKFMQPWSEYSKAEIKPIRTTLGTEIRRYELVSWNPPKHFYVTLEDVVTKQVYTGVYVSKHCNSSGSLKAGDEYNIRVTRYTWSTQPGVEYTEFQNLYETFCS